MKKKSILLLLLVCLFSLVIGTFGCTITGPSSQVEVATIEEVQAKNDFAKVLSENSNVVVNVATFGENVEYCFSKTEDGKVLVDARDGQGRYMSQRDGAIYNVELDRSVLEICPNAVHTNCCDLYEFADVVLLMQGCNSAYENEKFVYSTEKDALRYEFVVNPDTLLIESFTLAPDGEVPAEGLGATLTFAYGVEADWAGYAYEQMTTAENEEDIRNFELRIHPLTENEQVRNFVVNSGIEVEMLKAENGDSYYLYKNVTCTADIEDFSEILEEYNDFRIYATNSHVEISFDFLLTESDVEQFANYVENFINLAKTSTDFEEIEFAREIMEDKMGYFVHQYYMGTIKYYKDTSSSSGNDAYDFAVETYNDAYVKYIDAYKAVYELEENEYGKWLFEGWSEEDLAILEKDNEAISALDKRNAEIEQEFNSLKTSSSTWSADVEVLYEEFVANNQEIARLNGYDNAYDYFCQESYSRNYTEEERAELKAGIRDFIIKYEAKAKNTFTKIKNNLTTSEKTAYNAVVYSNITTIKNEYIGGYINSYNNSLKDKMSAVYDKKACVFATSNKSQGAAFANYSSYYEEAFTFFGKDYQNLFTFIHELGHYVSFSGYDAGMPYDFAETHSQGNEWMLLYYLDGKINETVYDLLVYNNLASAMSSMVRGMLIDEFEYRVYTAETPYTAEQYKDVFTSVLEEFGIRASYLNMYYKNYAQLVIIGSPCYYLNYVTSSMASIGFYTLAKAKGYEAAQEVYRKLQEDCDLSMSYAQIVKSIGLPSPFEIESYEMLIEVFFPEEA